MAENVSPIISASTGRLAETKRLLANYHSDQPRLRLIEHLDGKAERSHRQALLNDASYRVID